MIYTYPDDIWDLIEDNREKLEKKPEVIAEDNEVTVYLSVSHGVPIISVYSGGNEAMAEAIFSEADAKRTAERIYAEAIIDDEPVDVDEVIQAREEELDLAIEDLLLVVFDEGDALAIDLEEAKEKILTFLSNEYPEILIYRPMLVDDDGEEVYSEFPYSEYEIEIEG